MEDLMIENMSIASASASEVAHQSRVRAIRVRRKMRFLTAMIPELLVGPCFRCTELLI